MAKHTRAMTHLESSDRVYVGEVGGTGRERVYVSFGEELDVFASAEVMESMLVTALMGVQSIIDSREES